MTRRIYTINDYLKEIFNTKIAKLSLPGGTTCPNRDGTKGTGGCIFCSESGSGDMAGDINDQIALLSDKWPNVHKYLAYFQSYTSTYAPAEVLRKRFYEVLDRDDVVGIAVATRPDCLDDDILELLDEINRTHFIWVELGLQTIRDDTAERINRCYDLKVYDKAVKDLNGLGIRYVTHIILGLPGETKNDMKDSLRYVCSDPVFGIKLHMLNTVKGSAMEKLYPGYTSFESIDEYIDLVCDLLEITPPDVTIHRLTGDVPRPLLIAPEWSYKKRTILNGIQREMKKRGSFQGIKSCRA